MKPSAGPRTAKLLHCRALGRGFLGERSRITGLLFRKTPRVPPLSVRFSPQEKLDLEEKDKVALSEGFVPTQWKMVDRSLARPRNVTFYILAVSV